MRDFLIVAFFMLFTHGCVSALALYTTSADFFFSILPLSYSVCYSLNLITLRVSRVIKRHVDYFLFPHHDSRENSEIALSRFLVIGSLQRGALAQSKEKASDFVQDRVRIKDLYIFFLLFCLQWKLRDIFMWFWLKGTFLLSA